MKLLLISLLASAVIAGNCTNTGTVNIGDTIGDGPGDYDANIQKEDCSWSFGPAVIGQYLGLRFSEFHLNVGCK